MKASKINDASSLACDQPLAHNDWFSAGHTVSKLRDDGQGKQIMHSNFDLWIDSTTIEAENVSDEGDMHILPNGDILEAGRTIDPASGHDCEYEEIWSVEDIQVTNLTTENKPEYLCLQMNNGKHQRGRVIVLGQYCQGIQRDGNNVTVERWVWESDKREWKLERKVGSGIIPCSLAIAECESLQAGVCLNFEGFEWNVLEKGQISS